VSPAISRDSFSELKNYLGVYLQQGRPILDADWNEHQDIVVASLRRLVREALGDGSPNRGFAIDPLFPPPSPLLPLQGVGWTSRLDLAQTLGMIFGPVQFFLDVPGEALEDFESLEGFALGHPQGQPAPQGRLRIGRDRPYRGTGFLRLSGHLGAVQVTRTLPASRDLSGHELATFRFRLNHESPGTMRFFLEDEHGNRTRWSREDPALARDSWLPGFAAPLDIGLRIVTERLPPTFQFRGYTAQVFSRGGSAPMQWTVSAGTLPTGLVLAPSGSGDASRTGTISGNPQNQGSFSFTVKVTDGGGNTAERELTLEIVDAGTFGGLEPPPQILTTAEWLSTLGRFDAPTGRPADLTAIRGYGFELYQDETHPLVWDLDDLRLGSAAAHQAAGRNNFIIRGSQRAQLLNQRTLLAALLATGGFDELRTLLDLLDVELDLLSGSSAETAGRMYVDGLPCLQVEDVLYTDQADPQDEPLTPPQSGEVRHDSVYLDVWTEPVTYVQDPAIRDVALGGPDTATRQAVRHRVRVAQGGETPKGDGIGGGMLATEGGYTAAANRLYLVEIDTPGDIGEQATFRWSDEHAATIQRVIEPLHQGSNEVVVEDATAFAKGDLILLRTELGSEPHEVASVFANVLTLASPTGGTFSLADRPMVQRWNAFRVPIPPDPGDATVSRAIDLNDGVQVRFGGRDLRAGDYWMFTARYLAGDDVSGIDPVTRIERLDFQRARGVVHHYATLAVITRDGDAEEPERILEVEDGRRRVADATTVTGALANTNVLTGTNYLGGLRLPGWSTDSRLVVFWSGELFISDTSVITADTDLTVRVMLYDDDMSDPVKIPAQGKLEQREAKIALGRVVRSVRLRLVLAKGDPSPGPQPPSSVPTSLQVFATIPQGFFVGLSRMQVTAVELRNGLLGAGSGLGRYVFPLHDLEPMPSGAPLPGPILAPEREPPPAGAPAAADDLVAVLLDQATPDADWIQAFRRYAVERLIPPREEG